MPRKKKVDLSAFSNALGELGMGDPIELSSPTNLDDPSMFTDGNADIENLDDINNKPAEDNTEAEDNANNEENNEDIPQEVLDRINNVNDPQNTQEDDNNEEDDNDEVDPTEAAGVSTFFDAFAEALHWDVPDEEKPQSVDDLINYISDVVEQNSVPEYADDRIAQLDEYVKKGGRFEDFYNNMSRTISYDNIDLEDEDNQKAVVRDYLKLQGYDDDAVRRKIERFEDADMLGDEAEDALGRLKQYSQRNLELQQQRQEQIMLQQQEEAKQFMTSLNNSINSLDNIRGISVPKEDRKALLDYITRTDADGLTQYQKDFNGNLVQNLIESAYFTMKGDALLGTAKRNGQTSAASKLRTMLRHQTKNHSSYNVDDKRRSVAEIASSIWR